jgi:glycosyltransferase involved in cell wall biosynthesis
MLTLSIIIPTAGRPTLDRTVETLLPQVHEGDQVLVVGDGEQPRAQQLVCGLPSPPWHYFEYGPTRDTGKSQREFAIARATGNYVCFMDDDDIFTENALATIRRRAGEHPGRLLMFRMEDRFGAILWTLPTLTYGNVGAPMIVAPNAPGKLGHWEVDDFQFITATAALQREPVWLEDIIAIVRPHEPRRSMPR